MGFLPYYVGGALVGLVIHGPRDQNVRWPMQLYKYHINKSARAHIHAGCCAGDLHHKLPAHNPHLCCRYAAARCLD